MKKAFSFLISGGLPALILSLAFSSSKAQINDYLLHNPVWRDSSTCAVPQPCIQYEGYNFYVNGDTTWNGLVYKKIFRKGAGEYVWFSPTPPQCSGSYSYVETEPSFILRSLGKQMFIKIQSEPSEQLLYDFDLEVGDTLPATYNNWPGNIIYVTAIDSFYTPYGYRKIFTLGGANWAQHLIEGVGSSHGLVEPLSNFFDCGYQLLCFSLNDTSWYPSQGISCNIPLSIGEVSAVSNISINPNPMTIQSIVTSPVVWKNATLSVIDSRGRIVYEVIGLKGNRATFSRNGLASGTYMVRISDGESTSFSKLLIAGD
jgi:hypothetical protein